MMAESIVQGVPNRIDADAIRQLSTDARSQNGWLPDPVSDAQAFFTGNPKAIEPTAFRNGSLQAAYLMLALRAVGLDVGPMSGFDAAKVDAEFFAGTTWRANLVCGIGRGDRSKVFGRSPRLTFENVTQAL